MRDDSPTPAPCGPGDFSAIRIVVESARFVVIDKPSGVLSVPGKGEENQACAASWVQAHFPHATGPLTVHRLDMDTSGLLLLALDAPTHRALSMQFEERAVEKCYEAMVTGRVAAAAGVIDLPLRADIERRPRQVVDRALGRPALTEWKRLGYEARAGLRGEGGTRLELVPRTGRTHQLRVHCAAAEAEGGLGHPILGDVLYGDPASAARLLLHATRLVFTDPGNHHLVRAESAAPF